MDIEAAVVEGIIYASWPTDADVESWKVLVLGPNRRVRKQLKLPADTIATEVNGLRNEFGPYEFKVIGLRANSPVVVGRVQSLDVGSTSHRKAPQASRR
jgi:hypothetical protein